MWLQNSFSAQNRIIRSNLKNTVKYVINMIRRIIRLRRMTHPWPKPYICDVHTVLLAWESPNTRCVYIHVYVRFWPTAVKTNLRRGKSKGCAFMALLNADFKGQRGVKTCPCT